MSVLLPSSDKTTIAGVSQTAVLPVEVQPIVVKVDEEKFALVLQQTSVSLFSEDPKTTIVPTSDRATVVSAGDMAVLIEGQAVPDWVLRTKITVSSNAPTNPNVGDVWIKKPV